MSNNSLKNFLPTSDFAPNGSFPDKQYCLRGIQSV